MKVSSSPLNPLRLLLEVSASMETKQIEALCASLGELGGKKVNEEEVCLVILQSMRDSGFLRGADAPFPKLQRGEEYDEVLAAQEAMDRLSV